MECTTANNVRVIPSASLKERRSIFAYIFPPDILDSAWSLAMDLVQI